MKTSTVRAISRKARIAAAILLILPAISLAQSGEPFSISVTLNYIDFELWDIHDAGYPGWWVGELEPGDTAGMSSAEAVHLVNRSNIAVDIAASARDYPDSTTMDTLWEPWEIDSFAGIDSFAFRWAIYPDHVAPDFADAVPALFTAQPVEDGVPAGEDRYLYAWLLVPFEGDSSEHHRLISEILLTPSIIGR